MLFHASLSIIDVLEEVTTFTHGCHEVEIYIVHVDLMEVYYIRVVHQEQNPQFSFQEFDRRVDTLPRDSLHSEFLI